jgi:endonuclease/exonuclease/phosphatase (EEP) superfamily protein YafD
MGQFKWVNLGWALLHFWAVIASLLLGLASTGRVWWVGDVLTHYWPQYGFVLLGCALLAWANQKWAFALFSTLMLAYCGWWVYPYLLPTPHSVSPRPPLRLLLSNVYTFRPSFQDVYDLIGQTDPDLVVLLELDPDHYVEVEQLTSQYPYRLHEPKLTGNAIFSRRPVADLAFQPFFPAGRVDVWLTLADPPLTLMATHTQAAVNPTAWQGRNHHFKLLSQEIKQVNTPVLVAGDLNLSPYSPYFLQFVEETQLQDARHGRGVLGTWPNPVFWGLPAGLTFISVPLDHLLHSPEVVVSQLQRLSIPGSDHHALLIEFTVISGGK